MSDDQEVVKTVYQGGKIVLTSDLEIDLDIYTLTVKGTVDMEGSGVTQEYVDTADAALQDQITALEARIAALEGAAP